MDNLFPDFISFSIEQSGERRSAAEWRPVKVSAPGPRHGLQCQRKANIVTPLSRPRPAPNDRASTALLEEVSPLCKSERGVPDAVCIVGPKVSSEKRRQTIEEERDELKVVLNIHNRLPVSHEIFSQSRATVHSIELKESEDCFRSAGNLKPQLRSDGAEGNVFPIFLATPQIASVYMSARQEIKAFHFNPGPIGMVVELKGIRLLCTKVMPGSQCSFHEQAIVGSEIIAVNGIRVLTLQSFVNEIQKAQSYTDRFIDITVSAFRGGRMKLDDMLSFSKKNKKMTSLLGNMFTKGIDKDHSHGIELPASAVDSSDESESESVEKAEDDDAVLFDPEDGSVARNEQDLDLGTSYTEVISRDLSTAESETESCAPEEPNERFCTGTISNKGAILDDNSSMGSSTKKKFMEVYRDDSDDESVSSKKSTEHLSLNVTEASSLDLDEGENNVEVTLTEVDSSDANKASISCEELATDTADDKEPLRLNIVALAPNVDTGLIDDELNDVQTNDSSNESDDDDVAINEELAAKIKQQGIVDALEEIATGEEIPVVLEEEKVEDDQSDEESEPGDVWEYATALEGQDYSPYRCLVCMPPSLERSANGWGNPQSFLHFANFSTEWYLEVFWVDHEGLLVPRVKLRSGERHNEMTSSELVWCIIATYVEKKNRRKRLITDDDNESVGGDSNALTPGRSNVMLLFKGGSSVLTNVRSSFLSWIPWYSLAFSQRSRLTFNTEKLKELDDSIDPPHLNIHVFDRHHKDL